MVFKLNGEEGKEIQIAIHFYLNNFKEQRDQRYLSPICCLINKLALKRVCMWEI